MTPNTCFLIPIITALLFTILVFMNFLGYWKADPIIQIIFFFVMVSAIFNAGVTTGKNSKFKS